MELREEPCAAAARREEAGGERLGEAGGVVVIVGGVQRREDEDEPCLVLDLVGQRGRPQQGRARLDQGGDDAGLALVQGGDQR